MIQRSSDLPRAATRVVPLVYKSLTPLISTGDSSPPDLIKSLDIIDMIWFTIFVISSCFRTLRALMNSTHSNQLTLPGIKITCCKQLGKSNHYGQAFTIPFFVLMDRRKQILNISRCISKDERSIY